MIMIVGSTRDDTLYFESIMTNKKTELVFNRYEIILGTLFNQEILLLNNVYTSYISSALVSYLISKYFIILVFSVGKCTAFSQNLKVGDIVISNKLYLADVDQTEEANAKLGQIPGFPAYYETQLDVFEYVSNALESRTYIPHFKGIYVSSNISYHNENQLSEFVEGEYAFGENKNVVFDNVSGGVAVGCHLHNIPFVAVKVVSKHFGEKQTAKDYSVVLKNYAGVGKAIVTCVGDIGTNDIIRGDD